MTEDRFSGAVRQNYTVYKVFAVFSGPKAVYNLFKLCYPVYFVITPQAMRSPAFPAGSVFMSSALA
jgi:hypothetical protein